MFNKEGRFDLKQDTTLSDLYRTGEHQLSDAGLLDLVQEMIVMCGFFRGLVF